MLKIKYFLHEKFYSLSHYYEVIFEKRKNKKNYSLIFFYKSLWNKVYIKNYNI